MYEEVKRKREQYAEENGPGKTFEEAKAFSHRLQGKEKHKKSITKRSFGFFFKMLSINFKKLTFKNFR